MPNLNVSVRATTLEQAKAEAEAAGLNLSAWVDKTITAAIWTERFSRQQARNEKLGVNAAWLEAEYASVEAARAAG